MTFWVKWVSIGELQITNGTRCGRYLIIFCVETARRSSSYHCMCSVQQEETMMRMSKYLWNKEWTEEERDYFFSSGAEHCIERDTEIVPGEMQSIFSEFGWLILSVNKMDAICRADEW